MIKLGFVSAILPEMSLFEVLNFAAETGFTCVEVMCWPLSKADRRYGGVTHVDLGRLNQESIASIRRTVEKTGVTFSGLGYYPNCLSQNAAEANTAIEQLKVIIQTAPQLGLTIVNTFIGRDHTKSTDENWPRMLETWHPLVRLAEDYGVQIGIENCPMLFTGDEWPGGKNLAVSPAIWHRLFHDIPSPNLGLNYDPSHMVWQQMDYLRPLEEFADRLFHLHLKDVAIDRKRLDQVGILAHPLQYHTPKLPGLGQIDWAAFFSKLVDVGYTGAACVEVEDRAFEGSLESRKQALRKSYEFLRGFL